jgi:hypothetical protein
MQPFVWRNSTALSVLITTILCLSLQVHSLPAIPSFGGREHSTAFKVRTSGPNYAGIVTHPPAQLQQAIFGDKSEPRQLPLSGLWTRGNLKENTYSKLDTLLHDNANALSYFYTLTIFGLGLNDHPDGLWKFYVRVDLAVTSSKEAKGHTKLPQLSVTFKQPHPNEANAFMYGDIHEMYELSEQDIVETIETDEPAVGVMEFISSRISRMSGFSYKHVGIEEFEMDVARTTRDTRVDNDF